MNTRYTKHLKSNWLAVHNNRKQRNNFSLRHKFSAVAGVDMTELCYMCDSVATSREHAPPKCIFPEKKDMGDGKDYRKNLTVVPSCDIHNLVKSADDLYLQLVLINGYFNNPLAEKQFITKLTRAFQRRPALLSAFHSTAKPVVVDGTETVAVTVDHSRFNVSMDHVIRALYFHTFDERLNAGLQIYSPLLLAMEEAQSERVNELTKNFCWAVRKHLSDKPKLGSNPEIFWYKIDHDIQKDVVCCEMRFYGGFDVFSSTRPKSRSNT